MVHDFGKQILTSISKSLHSSLFFVIEYFQEFTELSKICAVKKAHLEFVSAIVSKENHLKNERRVDVWKRLVLIH